MISENRSILSSLIILTVLNQHSEASSCPYMEGSIQFLFSMPLFVIIRLPKNS